MEFRLPDIGEGLSEAEVVTWLVKVGDHVNEDQPFVELQTDKALVEMPAPATGTVSRLGAEEGRLLKVGEVLVVIDDGAPSPKGPKKQPAATDEVADAPPEPAAPPVVSAQSPGRRPLATPATRRLAREAGVDLAEVRGSGPGGRITDDDVRAASQRLAGVVSFDADEERIALRGIRRRTSETMTRAWREIPHITGFHEVDALELLTLRSRLMAKAQAAGVPLTLTAFLVKAAALGLVEHPMVNSSIDTVAGEIVLKRRRNIGVAVAAPEGLIVPVIRDADTKPLLVIASEIEQLAQASRDRSLDLGVLQGGTFTVTNHGPLGGWFGTPVIKPPEAGILGFGRVQDRAVVVEGQVVVRPVLPMSFAADHRIVDGELMIAFCLTVKGLLQNPAELLLSGG